MNGTQMNSTNDLVVGVVKGFSWEPLKAYAASLLSSGFAGTKLMCVQDINAEARHNLERLGFVVVDFANTGSFMTERYAPAIDYLSKVVDTTRYVIWTDVSDVVFQSDPSVWLEKNLAPAKLLGCSEGVMLYQEPTNDSWVKQVSGEDYEWVRKEEQLCSGTIAGEAKEALALFRKIHEMSFTVPDYGFGRDQGLLNYILRLSPFKEVARVVRADDSFALQANWFLLNMQRENWTSAAPVFNLLTGTARCPSTGELYAILHQYNRDSSSWLGDFKTTVETRYTLPPERHLRPAPTKEEVTTHEVRRTDNRRGFLRSNTGRASQ